MSTPAAWRLHLAGAGAAGSSLARALIATGVELGLVARTTRERAAQRVAELGAGRPLDFDALCAGLDDDRPALLLVSLPDGALAEAAARLAAGRWPAGSVALHLSGATPAGVLAPLREAGLAVGGCHPLRSFTDPRHDAERLAGSVFALDGDPAALRVAEELVTRLRGRAIELRDGARVAWHAGASHAANHLVALVDQALDLLQDAGVARDTGRAALLPLLGDVLDHLADSAPAAALTGPVARGDVDVVAGHLARAEALDADLAVAYRALARRALRLASPRLSPDSARRLAALLEDAP